MRLTGDVKEITGEGMPTWKRPFDKGLLVVKFSVKFPDYVDPKYFPVRTASSFFSKTNKQTNAVCVDNICCLLFLLLLFLAFVVFLRAIRLWHTFCLELPNRWTHRGMMMGLWKRSSSKILVRPRTRAKADKEREEKSMKKKKKGQEEVMAIGALSDVHNSNNIFVICLTVYSNIK